MSEAVEEMTHMGEFDYVVVNDEFEVALETLRAIVLAERATTPQVQLTHEALVAQLLDPVTVDTI